MAIINHDTQSAKTTQKQDGRNICVIMRKMRPPGNHRNGSLATHAHVSKYMSFHKAIGVLAGRAHCIHDYIYVYIKNFFGLTHLYRMVSMSG